MIIFRRIIIYHKYDQINVNVGVGSFVTYFDYNTDLMYNWTHFENIHHFINDFRDIF